MIRTGLVFFKGLLFMAFAGFSQQSKIDSLHSVLTSQKEDSFKVQTLIELYKQYKNPDTARFYAEQARDLAEKINYTKGQALAYKNIGITYYNQSKRLLTLENWNKSLDIYKARNDSSGIASLLSIIGAVYMNQGDDNKAIEYYLSALTIAEKINEKQRIATVLNNMGSAFNHKPATRQKALDLFLRSLPISEELNEKLSIGTTSANIGEIYMIEKKLNDSAIYYFNKSLEAHANTDKVMQPLNDLGAIYDSMGNYSKALLYHQQADSLGRKYDHPRSQITAKLGMADIYQKTNKSLKALDAYLQAEKLAIKSEDDNFLLEKVYTGLAEIYASQRNYTKAFYYQKAFTDIHEKLYNRDAEKKLESAVFDYEIEKKENANKLLTAKIALSDLELNRQKFAKNALIAGLGLVSLIIFILYRDYLNKAKTNKLLDSQKAQIQTLLSNILPDEVAEELQRDGTATPKYYESASVLFTDFKSFTKHADHMSPQEVIAELNSCFIAFDDIMEKYNLEKIKTIGDAYMCAGGIPVPDPNHYWNMIKAAKDIQTTIIMRNKEREAKGLPAWEIRIGIHVGPIVAGVVGKKKYAYDIWGSTVNIASRMESNGEPGQINISSATYELIKDEYDCTHRGKIYAKNVGDIDMYFLGDKIKKGEVKQENKPILVG
ncbi:MAG: adenylate/guanylate cyclase domain-containing protein [Chitinophagaceae bacterium]